MTIAPTQSKFATTLTIASVILALAIVGFIVYSVQTSDLPLPTVGHVQFTGTVVTADYVNGINVLAVRYGSQPLRVFSAARYGCYIDGHTYTIAGNRPSPGADIEVRGSDIPPSCLP